MHIIHNVDMSHSPSRRTVSPPRGSRGVPGGIPVDYNEVKAAFEFFDVQKRGVLRPKDLKARLSAFYPNLTNKDYKFLISEPDFTIDALYKLLENNDLTNFDPVKEAFKVYDPKETGYLDEDALAAIMTQLGYGEITSEDMEVLIKTADVDGDGKVSLEDFRQMLQFNKEENPIKDEVEQLVKKTENEK